ncbi:MAG: ABC-F family ATP-binding cassette domain-containing protein [Gemmatimonadota bacterium]|nr:ABC-F family ATP-binding cassette domain-containing protein [Gemmatimonadota bacterium]
MTLVSFVEITKSFGGHNIFETVSGIIRRGDRVGVVGPNGAGKTTFCRALAGLESLDRGQVHLAKGLSLRYMEQEPRLTEGRTTVLEELLEACGEIHSLQSRISEYQQRLEAGPELPAGELAHYSELMERFQRLEGYSLRSRAEKLLTGLGLGESFFQAPAGTLSGGQLSRLMLAKALIEEPGLLFLDEPTNHLDLGAIEFLENFLLETSSTVVVISHDREFLDRVTGRTIEIQGGRVSSFNGNYSAWREHSLAQAETRERARKNYESKKDKIEDYIRRNLYGQKTRQAQSKRKMLERMAREAPDPKLTGPVMGKWNIDVSKKGGSLALETRSIGKAWPESPPLFENLDLTLMRGERLAVVGENGTGKSTLIQVLAGGIPPDSGRVVLGHAVTVAYLPQQVERPGSQNMRVIDYLAGKAPAMTLGQLRSYLAGFLFFGEMVEQDLASLSQGEFRRLVLAGLICSRANLLLLDEPTNHLDIYSREALQNALAGYPGTLVMISHDRRLLNALAGRILEFNHQGRGEKTVEYPGDYLYYKSKRQEAEQAAAAETGIERKSEKGPETPHGEKLRKPGDSGDEKRPLSKNRLRQLKERRQALEAQIAGLEEKKSALELELADPLTYKIQGRAAELAEAGEETRKIIAAAYMEWERLLEYD